MEDFLDMIGSEPKKKVYNHSREFSGRNIKHTVIAELKDVALVIARTNNDKEFIQGVASAVGYSHFGYGMYNEKIEEIEGDKLLITWESFSSCD